MRALYPDLSEDQSLEKARVSLATQVQVRIAVTALQVQVWIAAEGLRRSKCGSQPSIFCFVFVVRKRDEATQVQVRIAAPLG